MGDRVNLKSRLRNVFKRDPDTHEIKMLSGIDFRAGGQRHDVKCNKGRYRCRFQLYDASEKQAAEKWAMQKLSEKLRKF